MTTVDERPSIEAKPPKKPYVKRTRSDHSQNIRAAVQIVFLTLNVWLGVQFYFFVRQFETGILTGISRPPGIEGWLPIMGLMNLKATILTGEVPMIHPAAMWLLIAFLLTSLIARKAFCGWLCPVGTISEWLWKLGRDTFRRNFLLPRWLDIPLRSLKYILLGLFLYAVTSMSVQGLGAFTDSPYGLIADVKMLNFFRTLSMTGGIAIGVLILGSVFVKNLWCRYLCPYGALMGFASLISPMRIRRVESKCIDCAKCAKACPAALPVDRLIQIRSAECLGCMACVDVCPAEGALDMTFTAKRKIQAWHLAGAVVLIFCGVVGYAKLTDTWHSPIPLGAYERLVPNASEYDHP
jgi:polyferredoxin